MARRFSGFQVTGLLGGMLVVLPAARAEDCAAGERYFQQAREASQPAVRIEGLRRSLKECPTFEAWYLLGGAYREQGAFDQARQAFQAAWGLAGSDDARALALARGAQVMADLGQSSQAILELHTALAKHSNPPAWMREAVRALELVQSQRVVLAQEITRTLTTRSFGVLPRIDLRIHFTYDSAALDARGDTQVQELGKALADPNFAGRRFLIIGHTDQQGDAVYNQRLSERRAGTVASELARRYPVLAQRLHSEGHGERELLYPGTSEEDYRLNRRVEVRVE